MRALATAALVVLVTCRAGWTQTVQAAPPTTSQVPGPPRPSMPPRDVQQKPATGTARITGRVVSADGTALRRFPTWTMTGGGWLPRPGRTSAAMATPSA